MKKRKQHKPQIRIIEASNQSGLNPVQRRLLDQSENLIIQFPFMDDEINFVLQSIRNRLTNPKQAPKDMPATHKAILEVLYNRRGKHTAYASITTDSYNIHARETLDVANAKFMQASDQFYFGNLEDALQTQKEGFSHFCRYKEGMELFVAKTIKQKTAEIIAQANPHADIIPGFGFPDATEQSQISHIRIPNITYLTLNNTPQVSDEIYSTYLRNYHHQSSVFAPFSADYRTEIYRSFARELRINPNFELADQDHLRMIMFEILLNLSINELDVPSNNFRLEQSWLNTTRNALISAMSKDDILQAHAYSQEYWFGWDKSEMFVKAMKKHLPKAKTATQVTADKYIRTGFRIIESASTLNK